MKQLKHFVPAILISFCITMGVAEASPLATSGPVVAQDYINFPFGSQDVGSTPFEVSGLLLLSQPTRNIFALGTDYSYDYSLITYFTFFSEFDINGNGWIVGGPELKRLFESPLDYINLGRILGSAQPYTQTFDATEVMDAFISEYHGLQDHQWWITGFSACVADVYNPVPEPATILLLGSGLVGLARLRMKFRNN